MNKMMSKKPKIVIIGAGMAGLTAAKKLYTSPNSDHLFDLSVVDGGNRIGGRINSSEFCGDRIELGATWIHGIEGSPIYKIALETSSLNSPQPWEVMDGHQFHEPPITIAEGGHKLNPSFVDPISRVFKNLLNFSQGKAVDRDSVSSEVLKRLKGSSGNGIVSVGSFLREGLEAYWGVVKNEKEVKKIGDWSEKSLDEAIFAMHENIHSAYTSTDNLFSLDFKAESEYRMFPGEEITIARGFSSVIEHLASLLPVGMIELERKVEKIEWQLDNNRPVRLHFSDGSIMYADHVVVTVSLGVLKNGIKQDSGLFNPPLPSSKIQAISRLGFGLVDKVFLKLNQETEKFPMLQMVFHKNDSELRNPEIPNWIRRTSLLYPIYKNSRVVLSWFTGKEALEIESLSEEEICEGFSKTLSNLYEKEVKFEKVLRSKWGSDPLFLGSYSYVAVGSSGDDMDVLAEPLPETRGVDDRKKLQVLFAGEATHRTHYSTTHGAYLSGVREADRLLKHYNCIGV